MDMFEEMELADIDGAGEGRTFSCALSLLRFLPEIPNSALDLPRVRVAGLAGDTFRFGEYLVGLRLVCSLFGEADPDSALLATPMASLLPHYSAGGRVAQAVRADAYIDGATQMGSKVGSA